MAGIAGLTALLSGLAVHRRLHRLRVHLDRALYKANHDPLTGLPNREAALDYRYTAGPPDLVGLLDLDDFKSVNDRHGHHVGDELLINVAERLENAMGRQGITARLGGDEFLLIWTQPVPHPIQRGAAVLDEVCAPLITMGGHRLIPQASLGLARPGPGLAPAGLIAQADEAMYEAKRLDLDADDDEGATAGPRVRLHHGFYPLDLTGLEFPGRRALRDRPIDAGDAILPGEEGDTR